MRMRWAVDVGCRCESMGGLQGVEIQVGALSWIKDSGSKAGHGWGCARQ